MSSRDQMNISLKQYAELIENNKRVTRRNTNSNTVTHGQQQSTAPNNQNTNTQGGSGVGIESKYPSEKKRPGKKTSLIIDDEPEVIKKVKTNEASKTMNPSGGNVQQQDIANTQKNQYPQQFQQNASTANQSFPAGSIYNDDVFEELFDKLTDLERDPFLDAEVSSSLHGQFFLRDMNKIEGAYLTDLFVKKYSESQNLLNIQNGFVSNAGNKKKRRMLTIRNFREQKTNTQILDCTKQDILVLQNLAWLQLDSNQFQKYLRPGEKAQSKFSDFTLQGLHQVAWPVALLSCYGPLKDNIKQLFTSEDLSIMDSSDIFKFGNAPATMKESDLSLNISKNQPNEGSIMQTEPSSEQQQEIQPENVFGLQTQPNLARSLSQQYRQNEVLIWFIGTNRYAIVNMSDLTRFEDINREFIRQFFSHTRMREVLSTLVDLIKSYNTVVNSNKECQVTSENIKTMIHRIVKIRNSKPFKKKQQILNSNDDYAYSIILRIQENRQKGVTQLLVKNLETAKLSWMSLSSTERTIITSLNLPALSSQELKFNYILDTHLQDSHNPKEFALAFINRFLLRWYYEKSSLTPLLDGETERILQNAIRIKQEYTYQNMPLKLRNKERCKTCKYILYNLDFKGCFYCGAYYHTQCITHNHHRNIFACEECEPCSICYGKISEDNITCCECKTHFHKKCGFSIAYDINSIDKQYNMRWYCESCVQCCICNNKLSDFQNGYSFKDDQIYCSDCSEQLQKKEYCPVCKKFWSQESNKDMVQCTCLMWIHRNCDPLLKDDKRYEEFKSGMMKQHYRCGNCRKRVRRILMCQFIKVLSHLDFMKFYTKNEFDKIPNYQKLIKEPIDLFTMQKKAISGEYDSDPYECLLRDFSLLVKNALNFNAHHLEAFREATKLNLLGLAAFKFFSNQLKVEEYGLITMTENKSIEGQQLEFVKCIENQFLDIVFRTSQSNKELCSIEIINTKQDKSQQQMLLNQQQQNSFEAQQLQTENSASALGAASQLYLTSSTQLSYSEVSNIVEQSDVIYNYLAFLNSIVNEQSQIIVKFHDVSKTFEMFASRGDHDSKRIQTIIKNSQHLTNLAHTSQYLNDLMNNNNTLEESNHESQQDQSDQQPQSIIQGGLISFHSALKAEIEGFPNKGKPYSCFECPPVKFTNQNIHLLRESCCYLCGAFDGYKSLLFCTCCFESYHPYCLMISGRQEYFKIKMDRAMENREWQCPKCKICKICNKGPNITKNLYCQKCDTMAHFECVFKGMCVWSEPKSELYWQCNDCFGCSRCNTKTMFEDISKQVVVNLDFTDNYTLCYKCGFLDSYYRYCKLCMKYCKKIPTPLPSSQSSSLAVSNQPLVDFFEEKSVRLKYLDSYLEETLYQCKLCNQHYHKKCFEKTFPEHQSLFFCILCKENSQSYMQKLYENSLINTKCRIIHIRKVQELLPIVEPILEQQILQLKLSRKDIGDFIAEYLHYFESDQFSIYRNNTSAYEKLAQMLRDEKIILTPWNLRNMALFDEKTAATELVENIKLERSLANEVFNEDFVSSTLSSNYQTVCYDSLLQSYVPMQIFQLYTSKYSLQNTNLGLSVDSCLFKLECQSRCQYDYQYNSHTLQCEVLIYEDAKKHPLQLICSKQYEEIHQAVRDKLYARSIRFNTSSLVVNSGNNIQSNNVNSNNLSNHRFNSIPFNNSNTNSYNVIPNNMNNSNSFYSISNSNNFINFNALGQPSQPTPLQLQPQTSILASQSNSAMELEDDQEQLSLQSQVSILDQQPDQQIQYQQNRFSLVVVPSHRFSSSIFEITQKVFSEIARNRKNINIFRKIPLLEKNETNLSRFEIVGFQQNQGNISQGTAARRRDIALCIVLLQAQEEQLITVIREMLLEFVEKRKDKSKPTLTQLVTSSYQNFQKNLLGQVGQSPVSLQEIIQRFKEAAKKQILVDNNIIDDPMRDISCQLCTLKGTRKMCGRLLNFDVDKWVHANCALWTNEVKEHSDGALKNFLQAYKKAQQQVCKHCSKTGATIGCMIASCKDKYHFPCLLKSNGFFTDSKTVLCKRCWDIISTSNDTEIIMKMQHLYLVDNFKTDRRLFVSLSKQEGGQIDLGGECYNRFGSFILVKLDTNNANEDEFFSQYFFMRYIRPFVSQKAQSYVTVYWLKKKKDEYQLKSCLLSEHSKFLRNRNIELEQQSQIQQQPMLSQPQQPTHSQLVEFASPGVLTDVEVFNLDQLDCFTTLKGIQQLLQEKINQIFSRFKPDGNKYQDINKFVMEYIGFNIPQIIKATNPTLRTSSSKGNHGNMNNNNSSSLNNNSTNVLNHNNYQHIQISKINSFEEFFYAEQVESINPFDKQRILEKLHQHILTKPRIPQQAAAQNSSSIQPKNSLSILDQKDNNNGSGNNSNNAFNIPFLKHLIKESNSFGHFQKQTQKPTTVSNSFLRPDDIMQEANGDNAKQDTKQTLREKEIEKKIKLEYPNYINSKRRHSNVYAGPSKIHKYGLFAKTFFKQDDIVVEYLGETVRQVLADHREKNYVERGFGDCYMFKAMTDKIIDATFKGNEARYLNHSCNPSCASQVIEYEKDSKIVIYAKREIKPGEELTYDYCFDVEEDKIKCNCNGPNCRGEIN